MMDRGTTIYTQYAKRIDKIPKNGGPQLRPEAIKKDTKRFSTILSLFLYLLCTVHVLNYNLLYLTFPYPCCTDNHLVARIIRQSSVTF